VLDRRLLEEPWLEIDGISGASAGAMNAAVLIDGHARRSVRLPAFAVVAAEAQATSRHRLQAPSSRGRSPRRAEPPRQVGVTAGGPSVRQR
jgi:NTE family protein